MSCTRHVRPRHVRPRRTRSNPTISAKKPDASRRWHRRNILPKAPPPRDVRNVKDPD